MQPCPGAAWLVPGRAETSSGRAVCARWGLLCAGKSYLLPPLKTSEYTLRVFTSLGIVQALMYILEFATGGKEKPGPP